MSPIVKPLGLDENDYEYVILSILSSAHTWSRATLAGNPDSRRHFITTFRMRRRRNQVAKINVRSFIILRLAEGLTSFNKDNSANSSGESKVQWSLLECLFFENTRKNVQSNLLIVVVLVIEPKGLYYERAFVTLLHFKLHARFIFSISKIQLVVYYQCCVLIGWATTRLYVIAH